MQEKNIPLTTPVRYFKGVGPKRGEILSKLGIRTAEDVLYYLPVRYEDRSDFTAIKDLKPGEYHTIQGEVVEVSTRLTRSRQYLFNLLLADSTGSVNAAWFNQPYLKDYFKKAQKIVLYGKLEMYDRLQFVQPEYEILQSGEIDSLNIGRIVPVYSLTSGVNQRYLRSIVDEAISGCHCLMAEVLPTYIRAREKLADIRFAIKNIHFPVNFKSLEKAYRRIVFDEFFILQLALAFKRRQDKTEVALKHGSPGAMLESFRESLVFELTEAQKKAMADIERDMVASRPMSRLLQGDVGSGKTVVAAYALALTAENGFQGVIMAPTEVLARQHFITLSELLMPLGINVALLVGGVDQKTRMRSYEEISSGAVDVVVGTHAIIQEGLTFKRLGLAVIDEQHKFGVTQRAVLKQKGYNPHILVMTATPIPRTLALTVYGDMDISVIRELPKDRKAIATYWVEEARRAEVYNFIKEELDKGRQAYIVSPFIESKVPNDKFQMPDEFQMTNDKSRISGAEELFDDLRNGVFKDYKVGLLHGRMSSQEKDKIMNDFKKGGIDLLVSTVVIEVGIDVPNATVMLVENAERFGLAQLHQLRGRVGRGAHESYCILLANPGTEESLKRLEAIEKTLDGFQIAEVDLDIRGPGEFFGTRQHGLPEIRFGHISKDFDIMEIARKEAFGVVAQDPGLREEHHRLLRERLISRFSGNMKFLNAG